MKPVDPSLLGEIAGDVRAGKSRGEIVRALRGRGCSKEEAERLHDRARLDVHREELPIRLRQSGRRHLVIGLVALVAALAVAGLTMRLVLHVLMSGDSGMPLAAKLRVAQFVVFAIPILVLSVVEILWARSRFRMARRLEGKDRPLE